MSALASQPFSLPPLEVQWRYSQMQNPEGKLVGILRERVAASY